MRIAFDGSTLRPRRTGVGYYTEHLLRHLAEEAPEEELIVVSNRPVQTTTPLPPGVRLVAARGRAPRLLWMQMLTPHTLRRLQPDVVHFTNGMLPLLSAAPSVVTIHDMSLTLFPQYHPARRVLLHRPFVNAAARRADAIITVSQSAKRDIVRLCGVAAGRVHVVHEAAAPAFRPVTDAAELARVKRKYGLADRLILHVGAIEPRKNLATLIDAFAARRRSGDLCHQLVCVGPYGWLSGHLESRIERLGIGGAVAFTGYVPFSDLPAIYSAAEIFVFPSVYEGFGLPVVEAMACGTPVITGRTSSLPEIAGGAIEHVDSLDRDALGDAMVALAADADRRRQCTALGLERARQFSWSRAARETLDVYRHVARERSLATRPATHADSTVAESARAGAR